MGEVAGTQARALWPVELWSEPVNAQVAAAASASVLRKGAVILTPHRKWRHAESIFYYLFTMPIPYLGS